MKKLISALLILNLIVVVESIAGEKSPLKPLEKITGPENEKEACEALIAHVVKEGLYSGIHKECLLCELEANDGRTFEFALRFNKGKCGGDFASTLLDRFLIFQRSPVILWYDSSQDRYLPWEYAFTYKKAR